MKKFKVCHLVFLCLLISLIFSILAWANPTSWQVQVWGAGKEIKAVKNINLEEIKQMPSVTLRATLRKSDGTVKTNQYTGVTLKQFLQQAGLKGEFKTVQIAAQDDYLVELTKDLAYKEGTILAYAKDGQELGLKNGGPLQMVVNGETGMYWVQKVTKVIIKK